MNWAHPLTFLAKALTVYFLVDAIVVQRAVIA
jgi:hypothetical protein